MISNLVKGNPAPSPEIQSVCWREGRVQEWVGLLRTSLGDYGFPSMGNRPQELPTDTQHCLLLGLAASQHKLIQLPAVGGLPRDFAGRDLIHLCEPVKEAPDSVLVGIVNKTLSPHPT